MLLAVEIGTEKRQANRLSPFGKPAVGASYHRPANFLQTPVLILAAEIAATADGTHA